MFLSYKTYGVYKLDMGCFNHAFMRGERRYRAPRWSLAFRAPSSGASFSGFAAAAAPAFRRPHARRMETVACFVH